MGKGIKKQFPVKKYAEKPDINGPFIITQALYHWPKHATTSLQQFCK